MSETEKNSTSCCLSAATYMVTKMTIIGSATDCIRCHNNMISRQRRTHADQQPNLHLGFDPPWPHDYWVHFQTHCLVAQPHDITMQISVDNNARPHNQQIINSPGLPTAHGSSTCGKKFSCVPQNIRPPSCCEASDWLQCQRDPLF